MTDTNEYKGPLTGLNVIDFGWYYAGPMAGMLLADQGANVIRIVKPGEKELPEPQFSVLNRNKKILKQNLKSPEGRNQVLSLIERADVVIENFRPGVMKRLGLDYASVRQSNPELIYLSLPGFASTDKARAHIQAWEGVLSAAACLYTEISEFRQFLNYPPLYTSLPFCSTYGAMNGALAIMAALIARDKYGVGTVLEVPLVDAGITAFEGDFFGKKPFYTLRALTDPESATDIPLPNSIKACAVSREDKPGIQAQKLEKARQEMMDLYFSYKIYPCADGKGIYLYLSNALARPILKALGIDKKVKEEGFVIEDPWEYSLGNNIGNFGNKLNPERKLRLMALIGEALQAKPAAEWETLLNRSGLHATVIRTRDEWLAIEAHLESGFLARMDTDTSSLIVPGRLVGVRGSQGDIFNEAFSAPEPITLEQALSLWPKRARNEPGPGVTSVKKSDLLKGLKVLDLANFVAGPTISVHLAAFGADVIKQDAPRYDFHMGPLVLLTNQGKRNILVDMKCAPGREIFQRLVTWADVVVHNSADGTADRLGATQAQLKQINPNIVVCQMGAFNGPLPGGWGTRGGNEPLIQAACGVMTQYGSPEQPHRCSQIGIGDVPGGFCGAFATLLGVYQRQKTGEGTECRTALAQVGNYVQLPFMISNNGNSNWGDAQGQFEVGQSWWQRFYRCTDGWLYVGTAEKDAPCLAEIVTGTANADENALESAFAKHSCDHWRTRLDAADIACHRVMSVEDHLNESGTKSVDNWTADETANGAGEILCWEEHPSGIPFITPAPDYVRVGEARTYKRLTPAPRLGAHTEEVLRELGYSDEEVAHLIDIRAAHNYFPPLGGKEAYLFPLKK